MLSLVILPDELLRLVHEYLLPPPAAYCRVHDKAAPLRCTCKIAHAALSQVTRKMNTTEDCVSLHSLTGGNYDAVCSRLAARGHEYACARHSRPRAVCVVHECCDPCASAESKKEVLLAMRATARQVMVEKKSLRFQFSSWAHLAHFQYVLRSAKINLSSKYSPIVSRVAGGIRVSWVDIGKRRPSLIQ